MRIGCPPQLSDSVVAWSEQYPLLVPVFNPEVPLSAFLNPYPGIGMALSMVAPHDERRSGPSSRHVRVLAVSPDGHFMGRLCAKFYSVSCQDMEYFWKSCAYQLECASKQPMPVPNHWALETPMDCLESLTDLKSWKFDRHSNAGQAINSMLSRSLAGRGSIDQGDSTVRDREIQDRLSSQFSEVVHTFLGNALYPGMFSLLVARPKCSYSTLHRLMSLAMLESNSGRGYLEVAIRTESLAILDLATREDGKAVLRAIFEGRSLPKLLKQEFDMDAGIHRRTLQRLTAPNQPCTTNPVLANLPMSANTLLASLPVLKLIPYERWPRTHECWCDVFGLASELHNLDIDDGLKQRLLFRLLDRKIEEPSHSLFLILEYCKTLCVAAKNLAGMNLELQRASSIVIDLVERSDYHDLEELLDIDEIGPTVVLVSTISGVDVNTLTRELFSLAPSVPEDFECAPYVIEPLRNINACMEHGISASMCIRAPEHAIHYGAGACALYKVSHWSGAPLGTIACAFDNSDPSAAEVGVWEFNGVNNNQTNVDLQSLSAALAKRFSEPAHLAKFATYTEAVSAFRLLAGARG